MSAIRYNGYGQISQLTYGNGTTTSYSYATGNTNKATTLMGSTVNAKEQGASAFTPVLSRTYTYNKQGMVAQMNRSVAGSLLSQVGSASFTDAYTYDQFGRLDAHAQSKGGTSIYSLDMQYNQAGGITFKTSNGSGFMNASALNYDLLYSYSGNYGHQLERIDDPVNASTTYFTYNTSGSITQIDDPSQAIAQNFFWNEQKQLTGVSNQQGVHHYVYDHSGERIMKSSLINSTVYLNDQVIDNVSNLEPYTVYVNPYYVVTGLVGGDRVSKHYYMNQQRVATDITINYDPNGTGGGEQEQSLAKDPASAAPELSPALTNFNEVLVGLGQKPLDTASLKLPTIESYYPEAAKTPATSSSAEGNPSAPRILFWYHPDYLGNVDLITERDGYTHEFFMYNPWGEEMHQWNANTYAFTSPYRFNAKELDPETGLAYYGARYYQNKIGVWLSVDPHAENYPSLSPYTYVANNPINAIDPDGRDIWELNSSGKVINRIENTEIDQFVIIDNDGDRIEGNTYDYGTVTQRKGHKDSQKRDITFFEVSGDQNATEIFEFFGDNYTTKSDMAVEWTHAKVDTENSGRNIIGTIHEPNKTSVGHYLRQTGYTLREVNHNHPNGSDPSGQPRQPDGKPATHDIRGAEAYQDKFPNVRLNVYRSRTVYPEKGGYHPYDRKGFISSSFPGWRTSGE